MADRIATTSYREIPSYVTKDGSMIRELMHPDHHAVQNQSLAEARVAVGECTKKHCHQKTEELYYIAQGSGRMTLGDEQFEVESGDTVCIVPGTFHCIENTGDNELVILCCCAPAYSHEDTFQSAE